MQWFIKKYFFIPPYFFPTVHAFFVMKMIINIVLHLLCWPVASPQMVGAEIPLSDTISKLSSEQRPKPAKRLFINHTSPFDFKLFVHCCQILHYSFHLSKYAWDYVKLGTPPAVATLTGAASSNVSNSSRNWQMLSLAFSMLKAQLVKEVRLVGVTIMELLVDTVSPQVEGTSAANIVLYSV